MADDIIVTSPAAAAPVQTEAQVQLAQNMAIALNGGFPPEIKTDVVPAGDGAAAPVVVAPPVDYFSHIKEKFGYNTHEDAIQDIEGLRAFKAAPPVVAPTFENADSENLFKAIAKGDRATVYQILQKEQEIERYLSADVTADTAADVVKLGMKLKYPDLTPAEINYKFNKQFSTTPKPVQLAGEEVADYNERLGEWQEIANDKAMDLMIEAKLAKPELQSAKSKLVLPEINSTPDEKYSQYLKALEDRPQLEAEQVRKDAEAQAAYKAFTPKTIETKLPFIDEPNKINFEFQYEPDPESFAKAQAMAFDINSFFESFYDKDGNPDRKAFMDAIFFAKNKNTVILEAIKQGKNAAIKAMLPDNSQGGLIRQMTTVPEPSELHKQMQQAGIV